MILWLASGLSVAALALITIFPAVGVLLLLVSKPLTDTTFAQPLVFGFRLTELVAVAVPLVVGWYAIFSSETRAIRHMPLKVVWGIYAGDILLFSLLIGMNQGALAGANVFFRQMNGVVGFFLIQALFHTDKGLRNLLLALLIAGLFPMGVGVYQLLTGTVWIHAQAEGVTRYIGLYHDAFTVRAYAFQTLIALILYAALYVPRNRLIKALAIGYGLLCVMVLIRAYSKAGILTLSIWTVTWTVFRRQFAILGVIAAGTLAVAAWYAAEVVANVYQLFHKELGALEGTIDTSRTFAGRWHGWEAMLGRWQEFSWLQKLFGSGEVATGAHNDYLLSLFHGGLFGLSVYLILLATVGITIGVNLWRKMEPLSLGACLVFLMWLVDSIGLVPSAYPGYQWFAWGVIGLSMRRRIEIPLGEPEQTFTSRSLKPTPSSLQQTRRYPLVPS